MLYQIEPTRKDNTIPSIAINAIPRLGKVPDAALNPLLETVIVFCIGFCSYFERGNHAIEDRLDEFGNVLDLHITVS